MIQALPDFAGQGYEAPATNFTLPFPPRLSNNSGETHVATGHNPATRGRQRRD